MRILFAKHPFEGERVIRTSPEISNRISSDSCYVRPNLYTGRALTADTLILNAKHRLRHMQLFGRHLSSGVIQGLALTAYLRSDEQWLRLTAGMGLTKWGDDVTLPETAEVFLDNVAVWEGNGPPRGIGVFVLQPLEILNESVADENDQCPWDEERDPFEDEQIVDACRLVFVPWPGGELGPIPSVSSSRFRNQLVYRVFDYEKEHPDTPLPWERIGVPVGLACIDEDTGKVLFVDREAVVRKGGAPLSTRLMLARNGSPFLWESRIEQFIGHLYDIRQTVDEIPSARLYFDTLPPVGVLPRQALDFDTMSTGFFPSQFIVDAAPIPQEQLEVAMNASAGLAPFDLYRPEKIKLLVPVPQSVYEPDLLKKEEPDPIFLETLRRLVNEIRRWLAGRSYVRAMAGKVIGAIDAGQIPLFEDDTDHIPDEERFPVSVGRHADITEFGDLAVTEIKNLYTWIQDNAPGVSDNVIAALLRFPEKSDALKNIFHIVMNDIRKASSFEGLKKVRLDAKSDVEKAESLKDLDDFMANLKTDFVRADSFKGLEKYIDDIKENIRQTESFESFKGLENFIVGLKNDIKKTEDLLNSGYVKAESDMYRLRQVLLGNAKSSRLATSPAMGQIVSGETNQPTASDVESFFETVKQSSDSASLLERRILTIKKPLVERIYESPSVEVKSNAVKTKTAIFDSLADIPFEIDEEVTVVGGDKAVLNQAEYDALLSGLSDEKSRSVLDARANKSGQWVVISTKPLSGTEEETLGDQKEAVAAILQGKSSKKAVPLKDIMGKNALGKSISDGIFDPDPDDGDEADYFTAGITALEHGMSAMRTVEKRLNDYKKSLNQSEKVLAVLRMNASRWNDKLGEIDSKLTVLRHDALVTRSLFEEERTRLAAINDRRRAILDTSVTTLVFVRPRLVDPRLDVPSIPLYGEYVNPVPACLAEDFEATGELADMLDVFREIPIAWLTEGKGLVKLVTDPSSLVDILKQAKSRSFQMSDGSASVQTASYASVNKNAYGQAISKIVHANKQQKQAFAKQKALLDLASVSAKSLLQIADQAGTQVSLADLIEKGKASSKLAVKATKIMENLEDVAVCLYHLCDSLDPAIKLQWANMTSTYDKPVDLRRLDMLPTFDKIDFTVRRDLQNMVDYLFSQVDTGIEQARQTMNDLVRVCILLASHAPVSAIVKGYVDEPSSGKVGDFIDIIVKQGQIKVGMVATVFTEQAVAVQGVVTDITDKAARVKVTQASGGAAEFSVDKGSQAKFSSGKGRANAFGHSASGQA